MITVSNEIVQNMKIIAYSVTQARIH